MLAQNTNISELETTTPGTPTGTRTPGTPGRRTVQVQLINALGVLSVKSSTLNNLARHGKCDEIKGCLISESFSLWFKSPNKGAKLKRSCPGRVIWHLLLPSDKFSEIKPPLKDFCLKG